MASNHFDSAGQPRMVDVSEKPTSRRTAVAEGFVTMNAAAAAAVRSGDLRKGDVVGVARLAAIQATKWTDKLIPLCHSLPIESVDVQIGWHEASEEQPGETAVPDPCRSPADETHHCLRLAVTVGTTGKTGVEMESLTAASVGCLTVYDMLKSIDREIQIGPVRLVAKSGGVSGGFRRHR